MNPFPDFRKPLPDFKDSPRPFGETICVRWAGDHAVCGKRATVHVAWTEVEDGVEASPCCDEHWAEAQARWRILDHHEFGGWCDMPGTLFVYSWKSPPGFCALPIEDVGGLLEDMVTASEPASVGASG